MQVEMIVRSGGLEGVNRLLHPELLISSKVAGTRLVRLLAASVDCSKNLEFRNLLRKDTATSLAHLLADTSATVRVAAAGNAFITDIREIYLK